MEIAGPRQPRGARRRGVVTDPVDSAGVVGTAQFRVNAFVDDPYVRFLQPRVVVTVTMKKK